MERNGRVMVRMARESVLVFWRWPKNKIDEESKRFPILFTKSGLNKTKLIVARNTLPKDPQLSNWYWRKFRQFWTQDALNRSMLIGIFVSFG